MYKYAYGAEQRIHMHTSAGTLLMRSYHVLAYSHSMWEKRGGQNFTHIVTSFSVLPAHMEISITIDMRVPV